ncbi:hypothetical protein [Campylobacter helveticus]|nr:hypothetical protein [Campylobacter helveticus]MCR2039778.1 hypothetical protein [Campylobacter helveticus]MCR2055002.1 hypothetical protein [Campylobacter helveticus]MCR2056308.1 hypothetical protein [Campylobacter helveticus]MCR2060155.1 hypothetical protein [Campylobacter helveticus]MCR2062158.1 hypothetical protein [Campylobacter helveticus]
MKNLSTQEKRDLDSCVFQALGSKEENLWQILSHFFLKIKAFLTLRHTA